MIVRKDVHRQLDWRKSSRSGDSQPNCVELAPIDSDGFLVRDSKLSDESPVFGLSGRDLTSLFRSIG